MEAGNDKKTAPIDGEVTAVVSPELREIQQEPPVHRPAITVGGAPQAVMQTPKQLQSQMERDVKIREIINSYIKNNMVEGKDYGSINIKGHQSKPSLFKPGAEKFCGLFKIRPAFRKDPETVEMLGNKPGIIAYVCELVDTQGRIIGEGRGSSSVSPDAADFDVNKAIKIAEKRAQIDAVLRTGALSDFFTQDMEDAPREPKTASTAPSSEPQRENVPATQKQLDLIDKLKQERFEDEADFNAFCNEMIGKPIASSLKDASTLISELFEVEKLPADDKITEGEG